VIEHPDHASSAQRKREPDDRIARRLVVIRSERLVGFTRDDRIRESSSGNTELGHRVGRPARHRFRFVCCPVRHGIELPPIVLAKNDDGGAATRPMTTNEFPCSRAQEVAEASSRPVRISGPPCLTRRAPHLRPQSRQGGPTGHPRCILPSPLTRRQTGTGADEGPPRGTARPRRRVPYRRPTDASTRTRVARRRAAPSAGGSAPPTSLCVLSRPRAGRGRCRVRVEPVIMWGWSGGEVQRGTGRAHTCVEIVMGSLNGEQEGGSVGLRRPERKPRIRGPEPDRRSDAKCPMGTCHARRAEQAAARA